MNKNQVVEHNPIYLIFKSFIKLYLIIGAVMRVVLAWHIAPRRVL